ncbi:MAG TPA: hypothetical protein PKM01_04445 [Anaerolineaceae bacterium]|nr:hypothetical protein [Anaerolineaceae bacterium]
MNHRVVVILFAILSLAVLLQACTSVPAADEQLVDVATPIPPYIATDQAAALQARATRQASEGRMSELAAESTAVVLQMTQAAATEAFFLRQTEQAQAATATAAQRSIEATATAQAAIHTETALNAASTATQAAYNNQATSTSIALGLLQASATAQVERLAEQRESERQTLLFRTWAGRIALVILFAVGLFITWQSVSWVLLRAFGIHRLANRPVVITPDGKGGFNIFDISRSLHPGASISKAGKVLTAGGADDSQLQSQVTARAQAAELMLAANSGQATKPAQHRAILRQAIQAGTTPHPALPDGEVVDGQIIILPPEDPRVRPLLDEVAPKLIGEGDSQP